MGRVVQWLVVLGIALACGRLALGLPPTSLADYRLEEALLLGGLGMSPVLFLGLATASMVPDTRVKTTSKVRRALPSVFLGCAVLGIVTCNGVRPTREPLEPEVLEKVRSCALAEEALGPGIHRAMVGWQSSQVSRKNRPDWTRFDVLVAGDRAAGKVRVVASGILDANGVEHDEPLVFLRADLHTEDRTIDLLRCGAAVEGRVAARSLRGAVLEAEAAEVSVGQPCAIEVGPGSNPHNCRFQITCGGSTLYGKTKDFGYAVCGLVESDGHTWLAAKNAPPSERMGDLPLRNEEPRLTFDEREGRATLQALGGPERVVIGF